MCTFAATYSPRFPLEQRAQGESFLFYMLMNKIAYPKELKSFDEQIALLKQRGMYFEDEYNRSDEDFIVSFKAKYCNRFPPSWITLEITSLGTMSILYSNLKGGRCRRQIAKYFGVADTIMVSWLHTITYVRNICAHHSRLWNKTFGITPMMPRRTTFPFVTLPTKGTQHVYFVLCMILYLLNIINPSNTFRNKINVLLEEYPNIDIVAMGFPENWKEQPLWKS